MSTEKYSAATSRGNLLTTELNALADAGVCAPGTELDNSSNKDVWAFAVLDVDFVSAPTALSTVDLYAVIAADGTNYEQGGATAGGIPPPGSAYLGTFQIDDTTAAQKIVSNKFRLRGPFKHKFLVQNRSGQAFPATGSTIGVYTFNREIL